MLTLVIGGAASGKSAYAEHLAVQSGGPRYYLATMQVWDAECAARVAKHRAMRAQKQFSTVECPQNLHLVRLPQQSTALLEDLGNLAANELYRPDGSLMPVVQADIDEGPAHARHAMSIHIRHLLNTLKG